MTWSGGTLGGALTIPAAANLACIGAGTKTLDSVAVTESGLDDTGGQRRAAFDDAIVIENKGVWNFRRQIPSTPNGGKKWLNNSGTFRKTMSTAEVAFDVIQLQNSGVLDLQAGVISFPANTHTLSTGSRVVGNAILRVNGGTMNLNGTLTFEAPFEFTAGLVQGSATINGDMTWSGGVIPGGSNPAVFTINGNLGWSGGQLLGNVTANGQGAWSGGTLNGTLTVPAGAQLAIAAGAIKLMTGILNNRGRATLADNQMVQMEGGGEEGEGRREGGGGRGGTTALKSTISAPSKPRAALRGKPRMVTARCSTTPACFASWVPAC